MGVNKVIYDNNTLIDITDTTAEQSDVLSGKYFYDSAGNRVQGTLENGGSNIKFKVGTFTIEADATEYTLSDLDFKPKFLIVDSGNMGVADVARSVHWQYDEFTGKNFVCSHKSTNASVTIAVSSNYCQVYDYGFYIKQYLTLPLRAGTYTYIALTDE